MALKKSELYSSLWSGCDKLRGVWTPFQNDTSRWFLRDATIKAANTILVDHHHGLKLSSLWGDGSRSSDGQRFAVERNSLLGKRHTPPISTASTGTPGHLVCAREAASAPGGIVDNDTVLAIREHTSDSNRHDDGTPMD